MKKPAMMVPEVEKQFLVAADAPQWTQLVPAGFQSSWNPFRFNLPRLAQHDVDPTVNDSVDPFTQR